MNNLTHFNEQGRAKMVDVSDKPISTRTAVAKSSIKVNAVIYDQIINHKNKKAMFLVLHKSQVLWLQRIPHKLSLCVIH